LHSDRIENLQESRHPLQARAIHPAGLEADIQATPN
jgi:hypothetical protein